MEQNKIVGTWELISAKLYINGDAFPLFGNNPSGSLVFTNDMRFNVILNDQDVPKFNNEDRSQGTYEELLAATKGSLGLYGTYTVDEYGDFASQQVIGSTFPNWNGLHRSNEQLKLLRKENLLIENLYLESNVLVVIEWKLV
jgi:Lipocalin-like domain